MIIKSYGEYEIMVERLRRIDKKEYDSENEHRFILESIKACFRETMHQRDYIKQLEKKMKDLEILEILKKRLNIKIPYGSVNVISTNNDDDYLLFEVELKEHTKIEEWLENEK